MLGAHSRTNSMTLTVGQNRRDVLEPNIGAGDGCIIVTSKGHPIDDQGNYVLVDKSMPTHTGLLQAVS